MRTHITRALRIAALAVATVIASVTFGIVTAEPAPAHTIGEVRDAAFQVVSDLGIAAGAPVITCTLTVENPHDSNHVLGTVNVRGWVECSEPVTKIELYVDLNYQGVTVASNSTHVYGRATAQTNAWTGACVPGYYTGTAQTVIYAPPGYEPPIVYRSVTSPPSLVDCI